MSLRFVGLSSQMRTSSPFVIMLTTRLSPPPPLWVPHIFVSSAPLLNNKNSNKITERSSGGERREERRRRGRRRGRGRGRGRRKRRPPWALALAWRALTYKPGFLVRGPLLFIKLAHASLMLYHHPIVKISKECNKNSLEDEYYIVNLNHQCCPQDKEIMLEYIQNLTTPWALAREEPLHFFKLAYTS